MPLPCDKIKMPERGAKSGFGFPAQIPLKHQELHYIRSGRLDLSVDLMLSTPLRCMGSARFDLCLEHFQAKWFPVLVNKTSRDR